MRDSGLIKGKKRNNSLVMPFISFVWATPLLLMPWVYEHHILIKGSRGIKLEEIIKS